MVQVFGKYKPCFAGLSNGVSMGPIEYTGEDRISSSWRG